MKIGIDIGGSHVSVGIVNEENSILEQFEKDYTVEEKTHLIEVAEEFIITKIMDLSSKYQIERVGIAVPGTIFNGVIIRSVNLKVEDYPIKERLEQKLSKLTNINFEINFLNDAKSAAIAEFDYRKRRYNLNENANMLFLTLGTGIGGAYIYNGKLINGSNFPGCEFGHMVLKQFGVKCNCGKRGCFEKYGSILAFKKQCIERLNLSLDIPGPELRRKIEENLPILKDIIYEYVNDLAVGVSNLINIFEPDITVIGGGFARYDYLLIDLLKEKVLELLVNKRNEIKIETAKLGNDAGIIGLFV